MPNPFAVARRIAGMSFQEIQSRAKMGLRKRLDFWESLLGMNPLEVRISKPSSAAARFYFDQREVPLLAAEIRRTLPSDPESVIDSARRVQRRRFDLLGYRNLSFGDSEVSWQFDPVHNLSSPLAPWFRIPYLDFHQSGDHKIVWELSRHQSLMLLARAWLYSGDGSFLATLQDLWLSWQRANPYPMGINWASTLEVAFRCLSWIWVDHFVSGKEALPGDFRSKLRLGIGECAVYIERYLSTYFAPNTHLLGEALALFCIGVLYPQFERAPIWQHRGWKILLQESSKQVREDGFHFEQSVYYHVYALDIFLHARILATRNSIAIPQSYDRTIQLMAEGLAALGAAGQPPRFGDDDGGRLFDGRRNRTEHLLDPLATAALVYRRPDWKALAGGLREETIWLLGAAGIRTFGELPAARRDLRSGEFARSGYYIMPSSDAALILDAGPHGWGNGGHGHADALSMQLISRGHAFLTDPGAASYPQEKPERDQFRSTAAHNTLEIDGVSQADPTRAFAWGRHPAIAVQRWCPAREIVLFHASHDGYQRLDSPVTHDRWVLGWSDGTWFVVDRASGEGNHRLDLRWHLSPECSPDPTDLTNLWRYRLDDQILEIVTPGGGPWQVANETGKWSPAYGSVIPAPVLHFSSEGPLPRDLATLLALNPPGRVSMRKKSGDGVDVYLCGIEESKRLVVLAHGGTTWALGPIQCSAELLLIEYSGDEIRRLLVSGSPQLSIADESLSLTGVGAGVWEARTKQDTPVISESAATALLRVLERLEGPGPSEVLSAHQGSECNP